MLKKQKILEYGACSTGIFVLLILQILNSKFLLYAAPPPYAPKQRSELCEKVRESTIKVFLGQRWGSGTIIKRTGNQYFAITNGHVLHGSKEEYSIETSDLNNHRAFVIARFDQNPDRGNDLAILQFDSPNAYKTFRLRRIKQGEKVIAAGFPVDVTTSLPQNFKCTDSGDISYYLERPMKKGYQLGFFLSIHSGMSGGPLVTEGGEMIGINGMGDPAIISPNLYLFRDGRKVSEEIASKLHKPTTEILQQLSSSSWAIPSETLVDLLPKSLNLELSSKLNSNDSNSLLPEAEPILRSRDSIYIVPSQKITK